MADIDYAKFEAYSKATQKALIEFAKELLGFVEIFDRDGRNQVTVRDYKKGDFDLPALHAVEKQLNALIDNRITDFSNSFVTGWGPESHRRLTTDLVIKYKPDTAATLTDFLANTDEQHESVGKITIFADDSNGLTLYRKANKAKKCFFQSKGGTNARVKYLLKILKSVKPVPGAKLNTKPQLLSMEIASINKRVKASLGLNLNLIVNDGNTGYRSNLEAYDIEFV